MDPGTLASVVGSILGGIGGLFNSGSSSNTAAIVDHLEAVKGTILDNIFYAMRQNDDTVIDATGTINNKLDTLLDFTRIDLRELIRATTAPIQATVDLIWGQGQPAIQRIIDEARSNNDGLLRTLNAMQVGIDGEFKGITSILDDVLKFVKRETILQIENKIHIDNSVFDLVLGKIDTIIGDVLHHDRSILTGVVDVINGQFDDVLNTVYQGAVDQTVEMRRIADADTTKLPKEMAVLEGLLKGAEGAAMNNPIAGGLVEAFSWLSNNADDINKTVERILNRETSSDRPEADCMDHIKNANAAWKTGNFLVDMLVQVIMLLQIPLSMSMVKANRFMHFYRHCYPDQVLPAGDVVALLKRSKLSQQQAVEEIRKSGFSKRDATFLTQLGTTYPPMELLASMWLRGLVSDESANFVLKDMGYDEAWTEAVKKAFYYIPPPADLITMAVRDVWNDQVTKAFGQFDDFPPKFAQYAKQQGISEEWARNYWAAHWRLPSETMGFEMLHRGIIDENELKQLMQALDIMPGWRDRLIKLSYNPLTRVDIRRMHKLGVINDEEVERAYRDIGYNPENAKRLLQFTKELNKDNNTFSLDVTGDLSRATILSFYRNGTIDEATTTTLLLDLGINAAAIALFLRDEKMKKELKDRKHAVEVAIEEYDFGLTDYKTAFDKISGMNLSTNEKLLAQADLTRVRRRKNKVPSQKELVDMALLEIIDGDEYLKASATNGYDAVWAERLLLLKSASGGTHANA